ncbi:hypothetical protein GUJ93_ZPchr0011g28372 [Zizania palustris]|uniref:BHLH domain-containing protein n=1 Tax=Zizania palustris TaxID=103762 RepID=A0A8J6BRI5_ZIZPA|nr:hypothetical protein GUJ93_ZPchr0011g28372 [Zizania palustris]
MATGASSSSPCVSARASGSHKAGCGWVAATRSLRVLASLRPLSSSHAVGRGLPQLPWSSPPSSVPFCFRSTERAGGKRRLLPRTPGRRQGHSLFPEPSPGRRTAGEQLNPHAPMPQVRNRNLGMAADSESSGSLGGSSSAASEKAVDGSVDKRSQEKAPKKTHKAEREKLKRDQLNDLFIELSSMLDPDRQNSGKATVLGDAARVLRDLVSQVESLRKEQSALLTEHQYVSSEKNELQEENITLRAQILELHNELCARMGNNSLNLSNLAVSHPVANNSSNSATQPMPHQIWGNCPSLSNLAMAHPTDTLSPLQNQRHQSAGVSQVYAPRPQELQLFPGTSVSSEREQSRVGSNPATSSGLTDSLSGQLRLSLPQSSQEESSSGSRKCRKNVLA